MSISEIRRNNRVDVDKHKNLEQSNAKEKEKSKPLNVLKSVGSYNEQMRKKEEKHDQRILEWGKKLDTLTKKDGPKDGPANHDSHDRQEFHDIEKVFERQ